MQQDSRDRFYLYQEMLKQLKIMDGAIWKNAVGEMHSQYNELVCWILLYDERDLTMAHTKFCEVFKNFSEDLEPMQMALFYDYFVGPDMFEFNGLRGNETVFSALESGELGKRKHFVEEEYTGLSEPLYSRYET